MFLKNSKHDDFSKFTRKIDKRDKFKSKMDVKRPGRVVILKFLLFGQKWVLTGVEGGGGVSYFSTIR